MMGSSGGDGGVLFDAWMGSLSAKVSTGGPVEAVEETIVGSQKTTGVQVAKFFALFF